LILRPGICPARGAAAKRGKVTTPFWPRQRSPAAPWPLDPALVHMIRPWPPDQHDVVIEVEAAVGVPQATLACCGGEYVFRYNRSRSMQKDP
jgi:hypothetical protein